MVTLTGDQPAVLSFIARHMRETGGAPSFQEIADALGYASVSTAYFRVRHLEAAGLVTRIPLLSRSIRLTDAGRAAAQAEAVA